MARYQIRGHGERQHHCNCPYCTHNEKKRAEIDEVVEAPSPKVAEFIILKREGDVLGDFWWIEGPDIVELNH